MTALVQMLTPVDGVWTIPAEDPIDVPHTIQVGSAMGYQRADGSEEADLTVTLSEGVGILSTREARRLAYALIAAADYADELEIAAVA